MRSIRLLAVATGVLVLGTACGDGGGVGPNAAPVANFTPTTCTVNVACNFTDASTDDNNDITAWEWTFDDLASGTDNTSNVKNPVHTFAAARTYNVSLKVTDGGGESNTKTNPVIVSAAANAPPTASFTVNDCAGGTCVFTSTSTDADGNITTYAWNFGEPASATNTSAEQNPTHTFAAVTQATDFTVTLTVTDDDAATSVAATKIVTIQPPPAQLCSAGTGKVVNCDLGLTQTSTLTFTIISRSCEIGGNQLDVTQPIPVKNVTFNGCFGPPAINEPVTIMGAGGTPLVYQAGTIRLRFTQGTTTAPTANPQIRVEGTYPDWTLHIDDGGTPSQPADFDDIVVTLHATRQ